MSDSDQQAAARRDLSALISRVASGDRAAMRAVYERTSAKLYGTCLKLLGSASEAEDVLQDVYVTVWRKAGSFDAAKASPITWLSVMARNRSIDRLRRRKGGETGVEEAAGIPSDDPSAFELAAAAQEHGRLTDCLGQLDDKTQGAIRSAYFEGFTYSELASKLAVPLGTMKSRIRRGLKALKVCLEQ